MTKVLLIEDNRDILENIGELLELEGYEMIYAHNGKEGLALSEANRPNIILCDILMPEVDGYMVLSGLKSNPATASIPFVFLTASVDKRDIEKAFDLGVSGYINKPFDSKELLDTITRILSEVKVPAN